MRAGGSTKASSDLGSLSPGASSAEGGLEEGKGVSQRSSKVLEPRGQQTA